MFRIFALKLDYGDNSNNSLRNTQFDISFHSFLMTSSLCKIVPPSPTIILRNGKFTPPVIFPLITGWDGINFARQKWRKTNTANDSPLLGEFVILCKFFFQFCVFSLVQSISDLEAGRGVQVPTIQRECLLYQVEGTKEEKRYHFPH